jgi:hypothetical protein
MKFTQFLELEKLSETKNTPVRKLIETAEIATPGPINEADPEPGAEDKLDTKKGNIVTKKGRMRMALNKQAKKMQDGLNKDLGEKFIKPLIDQKVKVYQKMAEVGKGKQPKDILKALQGDLKNVKATTDKQIGLIEKTAQGIVDNYAKKIESALQKKGFKETSLADLQSYWTLLSAQVMNNVLARLAKLDDETVAKTIQDKGILNAAKIINKQILNKGLAGELAKKDGKIKELKAQVKKSIDAEKNEPEEKPAETPAEKPAEETKV